LRECAVIKGSKVIRPIDCEEAEKFKDDEEANVFVSAAEYDDVSKPVELREVKCWDLVLDIDVKDEDDAELKRVMEALNAVESVKVLFGVEPEVHFSGNKGYHVIVPCFSGPDVNAGKQVRSWLAFALTKAEGLGKDLALLNAKRIEALKRYGKWYGGLEAGKLKLRPKDVLIGLVKHLDVQVLMDAHRLVRAVGSIHPKTKKRVVKVEEHELVAALKELLKGKGSDGNGKGEKRKRTRRKLGNEPHA